MLDKDVHPPASCKTMATRRCEYCRVDIDLHVWEPHIRSVYHILQGKIVRQLLFRCWRGKRFEKPHPWVNCKTCKHRMSQQSDDMPIFHNLEFYGEIEDVEAREAIQAHSLTEKTASGDSFFCKTCAVRCHTEEYFEKHLNGMRHKLKITGGENKPPTPKSKQPKPATPINRKRKRDDSISRANAKKARPNDPDATVMEGQPDPTYCDVCDIYLKEKRNMSRHKKTVRHRNNLKERMTVQNEEAEELVTGKTNLEEFGFAVTGSEKHPGRNFFITFNKAVKYKVAKRLNRRMFQCTICLKRFRSNGFLRRHKTEHLHKVLSKRMEMTKVERKWKTLIEKLLLNKEVEIKPSRLTRIRQIREKQSQFAKMVVICNEFTSSSQTDPFPLSHSHCYLVTKEKYLFKQIKRYFRKKMNVKISDIERPLNFRETARYCTKTDRQAIVLNVPLKFTATAWRAALYAKDHKTINWGDEIPSTIALCDQKVFAGVFADEIRQSELQIICNRTDRALNSWQRELHTMLLQDNNSRTVFWVVDSVGGGGKSFFSQYAMRDGKGIIFNDFSYRDNSFLYNGEETVIFDIPRDTDLETVSLQLVEDLKNGYMISQKYEVKKKVFEIPSVLVFSNTRPDATKLSRDRWCVFNLQQDIETDEMYLQRDNSYNL